MKSSKNKLSITHIGWDTKEHLNNFDHWNRMNKYEFIFKYGSFEEQKYLKERIKDFKNPSILDFGCATGTTNKYLRLISKNINYEYKGVDISKPSIEKAKKYYSDEEFQLINQNSDFLKENKFDIVYSRDTVLHQTDPYKFIQSLLLATKKSLILRLRTRDKGKTIFDVENSCQLHYENYWMPYIILNFDELINFLKDQKHVCNIRVNKSYMALGGQNYRYLEKDLYYQKTGTAETALLIDLSNDNNTNKKNTIIETNLEGQMFIKSKRFKSALLKASSLLTNKFN